jgi:hypothetical protein
LTSEQYFCLRLSAKLRASGIGMTIPPPPPTHPQFVTTTTTTNATTRPIKNLLAYYVVNVYLGLLGLLFHVNGPLISKLFANSCKHSCKHWCKHSCHPSDLLDIAKSHRFRSVDIAKSHSYSCNSKLVTSSDLSNMTSRPLKNSLKSYDDFTITITMHLIIEGQGLSTPIITIPNAIQRTNSEPQNKLIEGQGLSTPIIIAVSVLNTAMSTPTSDCNTIIAKRIKMRRISVLFFIL